MSLVLTTELP